MLRKNDGVGVMNTGYVVVDVVDVGEERCYGKDE